MSNFMYASIVQIKLTQAVKEGSVHVFKILLVSAESFVTERVGVRIALFCKTAKRQNA